MSGLSSALVGAGCAIAGYLMGSLPFSVWLARYGLGRDLDEVGDGNPGATNVLKAGGPAWGLLALLLDYGKGFVPVWLALRWGVEGPWLALASVAPALGHATSPWLGFRGGKAVAAVGGSWAALLGWTGVLGPMVLLTGWFAIQSRDGWTVILAHASWLLVLLWLEVPGGIVGAWALQAALLMATHRDGLREPPALRGIPARTSDRRDG